MTACLSTTWFTEYFKSTVETHSAKKISVKIVLLIDCAPGHLRTLMKTYNEMSVVFMPANTASVCIHRPQSSFSFQVFLFKNTSPKP